MCVCVCMGVWVCVSHQLILDYVNKMMSFSLSTYETSGGLEIC